MKSTDKKYMIYKHVLPDGRTYVGVCEENNEEWKDYEAYRHNEDFWHNIVKFGWDNIEHKILITGIGQMRALKKKNELVNELGYIYDLSYKRSKEVRKRISESMPKKAVVQYTLDGKPMYIYESTRDAYRWTGIRNDYISRACKGKVKAAGGYIWKYADEADKIDEATEVSWKYAE